MEFRYDKLRDVPGPLARARDYYGQSTAGITEGDDTTWAGFAEVDAPLLRGLPLVESLTANVSARYTDQRIAGSDWTYKLGGEWQLIPELRIRGTYGTRGTRSALGDARQRAEARARPGHFGQAAPRARGEARHRTPARTAPPGPQRPDRQVPGPQPPAHQAPGPPTDNRPRRRRGRGRSGLRPVDRWPRPGRG